MLFRSVDSQASDSSAAGVPGVGSGSQAIGSSAAGLPGSGSHAVGSRAVGLPGMGLGLAAVGELAVGATARQADVLRVAAEAGHGLLAAALASIGTELTRRRGTLAGIVAHGDPALQLAAVASVLDPTVTVRGPGGTRTMPGEVFFTGRPLGPADLVTEVVFPGCPAGEGWGFERIAHRSTGPQLAGAAARVALDADGRCRLVRVAAYTLGHPGGELTAAAAHLIGRRPDAAAIEQAARAAAATVRTRSDALTTAEYRGHAVRTLIRRALTRAVHQAQTSVAAGR